MQTLTSEAHRANVRKTSWERFEKHEITTVAETERVQVYRCAAPDTIIHLFYVSIIPGAIVVSGDIGDMVIDRASGGLGWLRGAVNSMDYFLSKGSKIRETEFMPGDALKVFEEDDDSRDADGELTRWGKRQLRWKEEWLDRSRFEEDDPGRLWAQLAYEITDDSEFPRCLDYDYETLWCYEALRWFAARYKPLKADRLGRVLRWASRKIEGWRLRR